MNPWDLIPWACAIGVGLLILMVPVALFIGFIKLGWSVK